MLTVSGTLSHDLRGKGRAFTRDIGPVDRGGRPLRLPDETPAAGRCAAMPCSPNRL